MSGDLWGVVCYHHWYLRAGLEAQRRYFPIKVFNLKVMQNYPRVFSTHRIGLNPHLELICQLFKKLDFPLFWAYLGTPLGPFFGLKLLLRVAIE